MRRREADLDSLAPTDQSPLQQDYPSLTTQIKSTIFDWIG